MLLTTLIPLAPARAQSALTIGTTESLATLDPADAGDVFTWEVLTHLYTGLTRQKPDTLEYELALASDHSVSEDGLTHTFTIRADAAFDDGTAITAQTFADSINRVLRVNGNGRRIVADYVSAVSADADANTFTLTLIKPIPYLLALVSLPPYFPVHPETFAADRVVDAPATVISNGVYRVENFDRLHALTLTANPKWQGTPAKTTTITIQRFDFPADLREALKAGAVDMAWRGLSYDDMDNALKTDGIRLESAPGLQSFYLVIDISREYLDDVIARTGISYLLDRDRAVKVGLLNTGMPLLSLVPPQIDPAAPIYPTFDPVEAKAIFTTGSYSRYHRIDGQVQYSRLLYGELYVDAINALNSQLRLQEALGLAMVDTVPDTFNDQITRGQFRMIIVGWTPIVAHPAAYLEALIDSTGLLAAGAHFSNAQIDALMQQAATAAPAQQMELYQQVQQIALEQAVVIPLWQTDQRLLVRDDVQGIVIEPNFLLRYDQLERK
ncbi:MAG: ABC transporter substrate-binding protein [Anaerolineae bacterium]